MKGLREGGLGLSLGLGLAACSSLPVAPVGPVPPQANWEQREYKVRKHSAVPLSYTEGSAADDGNLWSSWAGKVKVGGEVMRLGDFAVYLESQGRGGEAVLARQGLSYNRRGQALTLVGTVLLAPVGVGMLVPLFAPPAFISISNARYVKPATLEYNAYLSRRWMSPEPPVVTWP